MAQVILNLEIDEILRAFTTGAGLTHQKNLIVSRHEKHARYSSGLRSEPLRQSPRTAAQALSGVSSGNAPLLRHGHLYHRQKIFL